VRAGISTDTPQDLKVSRVSDANEVRACERIVNNKCRSIEQKNESHRREQTVMKEHSITHCPS